MPSTACRCDGAIDSDQPRWRQIIIRFPVVNAFYLMFSGRHSPPSLEEVTQINSMVALVAALLLTIAFGIPFCMTYEEAAAANKRFSFGGPDLWKEFGVGVTTTGIEIGEYGCYVDASDTSCLTSGMGHVRAPINGDITLLMVPTFIDACALLTASLMTAVFISGSMAAINKRENPRSLDSLDGGAKAKKIPVEPYGKKVKQVESSHEVDETVVKVWWECAKWGIFANMMICFVGVFMVYSCLGLLIRIKFEQIDYARMCQKAGWIYSRNDPKTNMPLYVNGSFYDCMDHSANPTLVGSSLEEADKSHFGPLGMAYIYIAVIVFVQWLIFGYSSFFADVQMMKLRKAQKEDNFIF